MREGVSPIEVTKKAAVVDEEEEEEEEEEGSIVLVMVRVEVRDWAVAVVMKISERRVVKFIVQR
ncbi:hypothetical protein YB2330_002347 [Saitoella coloradoensis]